MNKASGHAVWVWDNQNGEDAHIYNNVVIDSVQPAFRLERSSTVYTHHNTLINTDGVTVNSLTGENNYLNNDYDVNSNPDKFAGQFTSPSWSSSPNPQFTPDFSRAYAYRLQSDSPLVDTGVPVSEVTADFDGIQRPQGPRHDIGAFEFIPAGVFECSDGMDNDGDSLIDYPDDPGCASGYDDDEYNAPPSPPSIPTNLQATAVSTSRIDLTWSPATDNVGVAGYKIYRDGVEIATAVDTSYSDTGLLPDTTYTYTVSAYDTEGSEGEMSDSASATTKELPSGQDIIEAESGTLTSPMRIVTDSSVSGGQYIESTGAESGTATYTFNIENSGTYMIIAKVYAPDYNHDSIYVKIDNEEEDTWDLNPTSSPAEFSVWREDEITKRGTGTFESPQYDPYPVELSQGMHTITFRGREENSLLDYFYLSSMTPTSDCIHEAEQKPCDGCIDTAELSDYIDLWKIGTVSMDELMVVIGLWKEGC